MSALIHKAFFSTDFIGLPINTEAIDGWVVKRFRNGRAALVLPVLTLGCKLMPIRRSIWSAAGPSQNRKKKTECSCSKGGDFDTGTGLPADSG